MKIPKAKGFEKRPNFHKQHCLTLRQLCWANVNRIFCELPVVRYMRMLEPLPINALIGSLLTSDVYRYLPKPSSCSSYADYSLNEDARNCSSCTLMSIARPLTFDGI
ncbi:hypothetical protein AVEN_195667-1 [Araneus ventricosus]|uniref:Uncharacterized protein n=1 Tax=Araneus ventricosus TaxID=182803 RepID=A0A4Y2B9F3_ARAVE|nr:hypothetical protein AVEN_195667-1 [Araneus ventricosus]